jgi:hypothetical protein
VLLQLSAEPFITSGGNITSVLSQNGIASGALLDPNYLSRPRLAIPPHKIWRLNWTIPFFPAAVARAAAMRDVPILRESAARAKTLGDFLIGAVLAVDR